MCKFYLGGDNLYGSRRDPSGEDSCFKCLIWLMSRVTGCLQCLCGNVRVVSWQSATSKPSGMHQCEARDYDVTSLHPLIQ
ncbi:hypothetical protein HBI12_112650 [Parastagonospora nodorum]|nr:hypothetical protein HBI12_112650 [Parastagonospora nodorum]KAH5425043.1 hypothetical protein HBI47_123430 [Parastagonospora nodorum]KAH5597818.1 hypothetical protein HBI45_167710 [Parastagonospora nodorum]KAH5996086.1 hypothetical protein HBI84_129310 [Parastagonospora nodorum]